MHSISRHYFISRRKCRHRLAFIYRREEINLSSICLVAYREQAFYQLNISGGIYAELYALLYRAAR